ncbi:MAG: GNAT family N-acetyltransferase [Pseudomonadota bacterium]
MGVVQAPVLKTERLILRPHSVRDRQAFCTMWRDPVILKYTIIDARSPQDAWMTLHRQLGSWPLLGYGSWAIAWRETDQFIGDAGFMNAMRPSTPEKREVPEVGYALSRDWHGKGIMSEALDAVHAWFDAEMPATETFALIDDDNPASIHLVHKHGYRFERRHDSDDRRGALYTRKPLP